MLKEQIFERLAEHPYFKEVENQVAREQAESREALAKRISELEQAEKRELPALMAQRDEMKERLDIAINCVNEARKKAALADYELSTTRDKLAREIRILKGELIETAPDELTEAQEFFRDRFFELARPGNLRRVSSEGRFSLISMRRQPASVETNQKAITRAMEYCRKAGELLEEMKLLPEPDLSRVEELKRGIPSIDDFSEYREPKPFEGLREQGAKFHVPYYQEPTDEIKELEKEIGVLLARPLPKVKPRVWPK